LEGLSKSDIDVIASFGMKRSRSSRRLKTKGKTLEASSFAGRFAVASWKNGRVVISKPRSDIGKAVKAVLSEMKVPIAKHVAMAARKKSGQKMKAPKSVKELKALADELAKSGKIEKLKSLARVDSPIKSEAGRKAMSLRAAIAKWEKEANSKRGANREEARRKVEVFQRFYTSAVRKFGRGG